MKLLPSLLVLLSPLSLRAETLREAASTFGPVLYGGAITKSGIGSQLYDNTARLHLGAISPENSMKMGPLRPTQATFNFGPADNIVRWAHAAGQQVRGHTLVWHEQNPGWVTAGGFTPAQLQSILFEHIDAVAAHYRGQAFCWDVVNEAFNTDGTLRSTIWYDTPGIGFAGMGTRYIEEAFRRARAADPETELFYNDFSNETANAKSNAIFAMCQDFLARAVPIHGVGFQMHLGSSGVNLGSFRANLQRFADLGLNLHITELDVRLPVDESGNATAADLAKQAEVYWNVLGAALANPRVTVVQTWGFTDLHSWIPGFFPGFGAALPFDKAYAKKPAYWAIWNAFANQAEKLPVSAASDAVTVVPDASSSAGAVRRLAADAVGDTATFAVDVPHPGSWNVRLGVRRSASAGQFQIAVAPAGGAFTNVGAVQEGYAASPTNADLDLGMFSFPAAGPASFRVTLSGKNPASNGLGVECDYIRLTPAAASTNAAPTITSIVDQAVAPDTQSAALAFTVDDAETAPGEFTVTSESLNPAVLPNSSLVLGGSGANRTLTIFAPAAPGAAAVVVKVSDGDRETAETLLVTIGDLDLATNGGFELGNTAGWSTVGAAGLALTAEGAPVRTGSFAGKLSSRTQVFHGVGQSFTSRMENGGTFYVSGWVRVANAASASTKITARITDGAGTRYTQVVAATANNTGWVRLASFFTLSYTGALNDLYLYFEGPPSGVDLLVDDFRVEPNTVPALSAIADRTIAKNTGTGAIPFTVNDAQTGTTGLIVSADSSNTALVPNANVVLGGSAGNRTVTVTPIADAAGSTTITISANDGRISGSRSFVLHVGTPLEQWRFTHFGTTTAAGVAANTADGDGDGVSNVLEFFLALNPKVASRTGLPAVAREGSDLTLSYTRSKAALTEINHEVQWSTDLQTWSTVGVTQQVLSETGTFEKVIARVPIGDAPAKFMRLGVSAP